MLVDKFAEFINSLPGLFAEINLEEIEIIDPSIMRDRNVVICIPKDKLEGFLQSMRDMEDHEDCLRRKAR